MKVFLLYCWKSMRTKQTKNMETNCPEFVDQFSIRYDKWKPSSQYTYIKQNAILQCIFSWYCDDYSHIEICKISLYSIDRLMRIQCDFNNKKKKSDEHTHTHLANSISHFMCFAPRFSGIGPNKSNRYDWNVQHKRMFEGWYAKYVEGNVCRFLFKRVAGPFPFYAIVLCVRCWGKREQIEKKI